jgi:hypothetical protein
MSFHIGVHVLHDVANCADYASDQLPAGNGRDVDRLPARSKRRKTRPDESAPQDRSQLNGADPEAT